MSRPRKSPLRVLLPEEREELEHLSRSQAAPAVVVNRAKVLLAVADGHTYNSAARAAGLVSDEAVSHLVARFNDEGSSALIPRHGGGPPVRYGVAEREQILQEARRSPDREKDGTATWSLTTLQRAIENTSLGHVSTYTIWRTLHESRLSWQKSRTWCETGVVQRKRKDGIAVVIDPDTEAKKKSDRASVS